MLKVSKLVNNKIKTRDCQNNKGFCSSQGQMGLGRSKSCKIRLSQHSIVLGLDLKLGQVQHQSIKE